MKIVSTNPGRNYEVIGEKESSSFDEIHEKVQKAQDAKKQWREIGLQKRIEYLRKLYTIFETHKEEIGKLTVEEMGMPISQVDMMDVDAGLEYFQWYLDNAEKYLAPEVTFEDESSINTVYYEPTGVAACLCAWNFPFTFIAWQVIQNLVVGNTVVFKHSTECILTGELFEKLITQANLPEGVFSEVYGSTEVGDALIHENIDLICFTGSTTVGQKIYKVAAEKFIKVVLELGGSAAGIVFEDADITQVVEGVYANRFGNSGQICDGLKRLIVHESRYQEVVDALKKDLSSKKVGDPLDPSTDLGPLVSKKQLDTLVEQVKDAVEKGAHVELGGEQPANLQGAYYLPTILTNPSKDMRVWTEEVFGPVLPIVAFKDEEQAIRMANHTEYGLGGYIFSKDKEKVQRVAAQIQTGMISVNNYMYVHPSSPFGGYKMSGIGREHGKYGLRELCEVKVVATEK